VAPYGQEFDVLLTQRYRLSILHGTCCPNGSPSFWSRNKKLISSSNNLIYKIYTNRIHLLYKIYTNLVTNIRCEIQQISSMKYATKQIEHILLVLNSKLECIWLNPQVFWIPYTLILFYANYNFHASSVRREVLKIDQNKTSPAT
jgi:hypothetical protein